MLRSSTPRRITGGRARCQANGEPQQAMMSSRLNAKLGTRHGIVNPSRNAESEPEPEKRRSLPAAPHPASAIPCGGTGAAHRVRSIWTRSSPRSEHLAGAGTRRRSSRMTSAGSVDPASPVRVSAVPGPSSSGTSTTATAAACPPTASREHRKPRGSAIEECAFMTPRSGRRMAASRLPGRNA